MSKVAHSFIHLLFVIALFILGHSSDASAQVGGQSTFDSPAEDDAYGMETLRLYENKLSQRQERIPMNWVQIREADVMWEKRLWRSIYVNDPFNVHFANPYQPLFEVLIDVMRKNKDIKAFADDDFTMPLSYQDIEDLLHVQDTILVMDPITMKEVQKVVRNDFDWQKVTKYKIKEDWVFDSKYSRLIVRILAIAPIREIWADDGTLIGEHPICWIYYPPLREKLMDYTTVNPYSPSMPLAWDEIFELRLFQSHIYKESNVRDLPFTNTHGLNREAIMRSEEVKRKMFEFEQFLWTY